MREEKETRKIKLGIIGLGQRGCGLLYTNLHVEEAEIYAVCDVYDDRIEWAQQRVKKEKGYEPKAYKDYKQLLADEKVEAVVIATSWEAHVAMAIDAMRAGKITGLEVSGAYDVEDCWALVQTYEQTKTPIMFLENCCFDKFELLSTNLVRHGRLGKVVYCHGAYGHDLRKEILGGVVNRHYRLNNYRARCCDNYPTHQLGPIAKLLNINRGNKFLTLSSVATVGGAGLEEFAASDKNPDKNQAGIRFHQGDIVNTTLTCANGEVVTLTLDTTLPRFYSREFTVRGTKGIALQDPNVIMLDGDERLEEFWTAREFIKKNIDCADEFKDYLPDEWKNITTDELNWGHGGIDYLQFKAFYRCILNGEEMPIDIYDAATWMCITPLSEQSIKNGGVPVAVPDFTRGQWHVREAKDVVKLPQVEGTPEKQYQLSGEIKKGVGGNAGENEGV